MNREELKRLWFSLPRTKPVKEIKAIVVEKLDGHMYDLIFQAVCDEMNNHPAFDSSLYLTEAGLELFEDEWFEFYHENHGRIMHKLMSKITN